MADENEPKQGLFEARTRPENFQNSGDVVQKTVENLDVAPDRAAKIGSGKASVEAAMADLVAQMAGGQEEAGQGDLLLDEQASLFSGPVKSGAKIMAANRGRGRPPGSQNKTSLRDTLLRMGYRHPALNLADIGNSTVKELMEELGMKPADAMNAIIKANAELLPYFESKRPTEIDVTVDRPMGVMIIGDVRLEQAADRKVIDLTNVDQAD